MGQIQWISVSKDVPIKVEVSDDEPSWDSMREFIGGGYLEHVSILMPDGSRAHMFVDEEGLLKDFAFNVRATEHYWRASLTQKGFLVPPTPIVGPAILLVNIPIEGYDF